MHAVWTYAQYLLVIPGSGATADGNETDSWIMFCEAAQPPEKAVKAMIRETKTGFRPMMSLILAKITITATIVST